MPRTLCTGNYAAGHTLALAGEANRSARGCAAGAYPITPQTEIIESLRAFPVQKGRVVAVESEHSAMGVCIGAAMAGARTFTASSSNGLAYMTENVFAAGYYRLPTVMIAVNRTLGPPWNIWVDQGDSLALRDAASVAHSFLLSLSKALGTDLLSQLNAGQVVTVPPAAGPTSSPRCWRAARTGWPAGTTLTSAARMAAGRSGTCTCKGSSKCPTTKAGPRPTSSSDEQAGFDGNDRNSAQPWRD